MTFVSILDVDKWQKIQKTSFRAENQYLNLQFVVIQGIHLICLKSIFIKIL